MSAENLAQSKQRILKNWEEQVRKLLPAARHESLPVLRDHIPEFLDYLEEVLKHGIDFVRQEIESFALHHGAERDLLTGYTVEEALAEYNILRKVIFSELEIRRPLTPEQRDIIFEVINLGLSKAAAEFTHLQLRRIEKSEQKFRILFHHAPVGIAEVDTSERRFLRVNPKYCEMIGYTEEEFLKLNIDDITHPDDMDGVLEKLEQIRSGEIKGCRREKRYIKKDGSIIWTEISVTTFYSEELEAPFNIVVAVDITDRKKTEMELHNIQKRFEKATSSEISDLKKTQLELEEARGKLQRITDIQPLLIGQIGKDFRYIFVNRAYEEWFGLPRSEIIGHYVWDVVGKEAFEIISPAINRALSGERVVFNSRIKYRIGSEKYVLAVYSPEIVQKGSVSSIFVSVIDISEQQKILDTLQEETVLRQKFVSTLSHDLRTPLTAAKMSAELIRRRSKEDNLINLSVRISDNISRANEMIEDLLDASKIRVGQALTPNFQHFNISELLHKTIENLISIHGERFELFTPDELMVWQDPNGIRRVIENLCTNAIKYGSPTENILIRLDYGIKKLMLCVHNEGNPLMNVDKLRLFEPFQRGPAHSIAGKKGWGIGLTVVKGITEAHHGEIFVDSSEKGTTFKISLPLDARKETDDNQININ